MARVPAARPHDESERLETLRALDVLDTDPEIEFDAIVRLAAQLCGTPIALISLIDEQRQWFKAKVGLDATETPREVAYCSHAILRDELMEVPDASADPRFVDNPLRTGEPHAQYYAGIPIHGRDGHKLGTLCVIDHKPRTLTQEQRVALETLAQQAERLFELRRLAHLHRGAATHAQAPDAQLGESALNPPTKLGAPQRRAIVFVALIFLATVVATYLVASAVRTSERTRLDQGAERARHFLEERGRTYSGILQGAAALFQASDYVSPQEFRSFIESLSLTRRYPAVAGVRYAQSIGEEQVDSFLAAARRENPAFRIHPASTAGSDHFVTRFVEPLDRNQRTLGHDFGTEAIRRTAALRAFETNAPAMSDRIQLISEPMAGPAFLVFAPIHTSTPFSNDLSSPRADRAWVAIGLRARDFVDGVTRAAGSDFDLRLIDSPRFSDSPLVGPVRPKLDQRAVHTTVEIAGQRWTLQVAPSASFDDGFTRALPWVVFLLGIAATGLAASLSLSAWRTEKLSRALAWQMTQALRQSEQDLQAANKKLTMMANFDALTGVANRRAFDARLTEEWARSQRQKTGLAVIMLDVDFFKVYNDRYGHPEGDECLRRVGECLRKHVARAGDFVARYGGEEFVVLLPGSASSGASALAEIVRAAVEATKIPHAGHPAGHVTASLGVASNERGVASAAELLAAADKALYRAKANGRNRVEIADT